MLRKEVDEVICLEEHEDFGSIGYYYLDFSQVSDDTVRDLIARSAPPPPSTPPSIDKRAVTGESR
jgi:predicted phosphoribosyltransferase